MKQLYLLISIFLLVFQSVFGQTPADSLKAPKDSVAATPPPAKQRRDTRPMKERIDFGFGSSFWFTANQTYIEICPIVAYRFPKALITGMGYRYIWRYSRLYGQDLNAYGPDFFARLNVTQRIYLWTEYEILQNEYFVQAAGQELATANVTTESMFGGIGYVRSIGKKGRGGISFQVLYNFLYDRDIYSPYYSAWTYRIGYFF